MVRAGRLRCGWAGLVAIAWLGCAPADRGPVELPVALAPASHGSCGDAKNPLEPMIVEWPATSRAELERSAAHGPVVVSYSGCVLKVLSSCRAGDASAYELERTTPAEDRIDIESTHDLHADLPLGVATLKGKLAEGTRLTLSYVTVGARVLRQPPAVLEGECEGATHYVGSIVLGAFSLLSRRAGAGAASATIAGATAGGAAESSEQISGSAGDLAVCKAQGLAAGTACQAALQLWLRPLPLAGGKPMAAGFGLGLAPPSPVAPVSSLSLPDAPRQARGDLAPVDVTVLELVQAAIDADRSTSLASAAKVEAWDRLARYAPQGRYAPTAVKRRDEWRRRSDAENARQTQLVVLCPRYRADRSKLDRLLRLGPTVLPDRDKSVYKKELEDAYAPWPELARCPEIEVAAAARAAWPALHGANDGMVAVPGGTFVMGSALPEDNATPLHRVTVDDLEMDVTEVTVAAYARCQRAGACTPRRSHASEDMWRCNDVQGHAGGESRDEAPANCMSFAQAGAYCRWAGKRLPTEEEWEYAARGADGRRYPWGEWGKNSDGYHRFSHDYCGVPGLDLGFRAGSLAANASPFGLRDMAGSVWEWTASRFSKRYDVAPTTAQRVARGGEYGWSNEPDCKPYDAAYRSARDPKDADSNLGVRCAR